MNTEEQVRELNMYQNMGITHPYTCDWAHQSSTAPQEVQAGKNKPFIAANIREIMDQYPDSISFQRMVELFNEVADKFYNQPSPQSQGMTAEQYMNTENMKQRLLKSVEETETMLTNIEMPPQKGIMPDDGRETDF